jgi:hypothetical protein
MPRGSTSLKCLPYDGDDGGDGDHDADPQQLGRGSFEDWVGTTEARLCLCACVVAGACGGARGNLRRERII